MIENNTDSNDEILENFESYGEDEPDKWSVDVTISRVRTPEGRKIKLDMRAEVNPKCCREARKGIQEFLGAVLSSAELL
jgi:hypothetical protein